MRKRPSSPLGVRLNVVFGLLAVAAMAGYGLYAWQAKWRVAQARQYERESLVNAGNGDATTVGGSFTLVNHDGKTVTEKDFAGKYLLVTFGFTYCPDVCPTKLQDMSLTLDELGSDAQWVQPVFISVDPQRDTPEQMKGYVSLYHNSIIGLTGTPEQIAATAKTFKVYYKRGEDVGDGNYMMDHSTAIYLLGQDSKVLDVFAEGTTPEAMATAIKTYLHK